MDKTHDNKDPGRSSQLALRHQKNGSIEGGANGKN
jgi:hypothetical protein